MFKFLKKENLQQEELEEVIQTELYPIFMKLCRDPVAEVRMSAGQQLPAILKRLDELQVAWMDEFVEELQDLATDRLFQHRLDKPAEKQTPHSSVVLLQFRIGGPVGFASTRFLFRVSTHLV